MTDTNTARQDFEKALSEATTEEQAYDALCALTASPGDVDSCERGQN